MIRHPQYQRSQQNARRPRGACIVEFAVVGPMVLLLLISLVFAGLATFRYVQLANVARYAARWAAVHGKSYANVTGTSQVTAQDVFNQAIKPRLIAMKPADLQWSVNWSSDGKLVTVSLAYAESAEAWFAGGTLHSQSTMFVAN